MNNHKHHWEPSRYYRLYKCVLPGCGAIGHKQRAEIERLGGEVEHLRDDAQRAHTRRLLDLLVDHEATIEAQAAEIERLRAKVYIGESRFPDLTWEARCLEATGDLREARAEIERLKALLDVAGAERGAC